MAGLETTAGNAAKGDAYRVKMRKKVYLSFVGVLAAVYFILLLILYYSESAQEGAAICTFGDAVWYSLVTLTTVGYGDVVPVTPLGHAVGVVFLLLATGITVTLRGDFVFYR